MIQPRVDYRLLGNVLDEYLTLGYSYVEVPWMVEERFVRATLPDGADPLVLGVAEPLLGKNSIRHYGKESHLVGSAEQGFLSLELPPGKYVGVTPCFRKEGGRGLFYQTGFMKIELFAWYNDPDQPTMWRDLMADAESVLCHYTGFPIIRVETSEGCDLEIAGIEIGSYGEHNHPEFGRWAYGTGLALPRFSVADAIGRVI